MDHGDGMGALEDEVLTDIDRAIAGSDDNHTLAGEESAAWKLGGVHVLAPEMLEASKLWNDRAAGESSSHDEVRGTQRNLGPSSKDGHSPAIVVDVVPGRRLELGVDPNDKILRDSILLKPVGQLVARGELRPRGWEWLV